MIREIIGKKMPPVIDLSQSELSFIAEVAAGLDNYKKDHVELFEVEIAAQFGFNRAITASSETGAVSVLLGALALQPGDEIVLSPVIDHWLIFALLHAGIVHIFADFGPDQISVSPEVAEKKISQRCKAILVSLPFGYPANLSELHAVAINADIPLVLEISESLGTTIEGRCVYEDADIALLSLREGKSDLSTGEGGVLLFRESSLADRAKSYSRFSDLDGINLGVNQKLSAVQCALANIRLKGLKAKLNLRQQALTKVFDELCQRAIPILEVPPESNAGVGVITYKGPYLSHFGKRVRPIVLAGKHAVLNGLQFEYPVAISTAQKLCCVLPSDYELAL